MDKAMKSIFGAFRMLRRRANELGQPGLSIWTDAGERAAGEVGAAVRDLSHRAETRSISLADEIRGMVADGSIDAAELKRLRVAPDRLRQVADDCHDIGEVVS